jgi:hypothetical protein
MELVDEWQECVNHLITTDGYMVAASPKELKLGQTLIDAALGHPFRVIGHATREDVVRQLELSTQFCRCKLAPPPASWHYYYKMVTD